jgi:DNA-binding transcriptional ArsR family regulator
MTEPRNPEQGGPGNRPELYVLERPEQLDALINPLRRRMISLLSASGPLSVRELAERMRRSPENMHYHVRALVGVGLVHVLGSRPTVRRDERLFDVVADAACTPPEADEADSPWAEAQEKIARADFRLLLDRFIAGIRNPGLKKSGDDRDHDYGVLTARMSREGLARTYKAITDLMRIVHEENTRGVGETYQFGYILAPVPEEGA